MSDINELYNILTSPENKDNYFTSVPSIDDFKVAMEGEDYQNKIHSIVVNDNIYPDMDKKAFRQSFVYDPIKVTQNPDNVINYLFRTTETPTEHTEGGKTWRKIQTQTGEAWHYKVPLGDFEFNFEMDGSRWRNVSKEKAKELNSKTEKQVKTVVNKDFFDKNPKEAIKELQTNYKNVFDFELTKTGTVEKGDRLSGIKMSTLDGKNTKTIPFDIDALKKGLELTEQALMNGDHSAHWGTLMSREEARNTDVYKKKAKLIEDKYNEAYNGIIDFVNTYSTNEDNLKIISNQKRNIEAYNKYKEFTKKDEDEIRKNFSIENQPDLFKRTLKYITKTGAGVYDEPYKKELKQAAKNLPQNATKEEIEKEARRIIINNAINKQQRINTEKFLYKAEKNKLSLEQTAPFTNIEYGEDQDFLKEIIEAGGKASKNEFVIKTEILGQKNNEIEELGFKTWQNLANNLNNLEYNFDNEIQEGEQIVTLTDGREVPKRLLDEYNDGRLKFAPHLSEIIRLQNDIIDSVPEFEQDVLHLDFLKRQYTNNFIPKTILGFRDLFLNVPTTSALFSDFGTPNIDEYQIYVEKKRELDKERQLLTKPMEFNEAFDSFYNFGRFMSNEFSTQISVLSTLAVPYLGWGTLLTSSYGEQYFNMTEKEILEDIDYSAWRKMYTSAGYAVPEFLFEYATTIPLLRGAGLALKGVFGAGVRNVTKQGVQEGIKASFPEFVKGSVLGSLGEGGTTITQNLITGKPWHENVDHSLFSGLMFESTLASVPMVTGAALNSISDYESTQEFRDNLIEISKLESKNKSLNNRKWLIKNNKNKKIDASVIEKINQDISNNTDIVNELSKQNETILKNQKESIMGRWLGWGKSNKNGVSGNAWSQFFKITTEQEKIRIQAEKIINNGSLLEIDKQKQLAVLKSYFDILQDGRNRARTENLSEFQSWLASEKLKLKKGESGELSEFRDLAKQNLKRGASEEDIEQEVRLIWNTTKINENLKKAKKNQLNKHLVPYQTIDEAVEKIKEFETNESFTEKNKADLIEQVLNGSHGFDGPNNKSYMIVESMARDGRLEIKTHELSHRVFSNINITEGEAFKELADLVLDWAAKNDKATYAKLLRQVERHDAGSLKGQFKSNEVIAVFLEEAAGGKIKMKHSDGGIFGMFAWGVSKKMKDDYGIDIDLAGESDAIKMLVGLGKKLKAGKITLSDIQTELSKNEIIKKAQERSKEILSKKFGKGESINMSQVYQEVEAMYSDDIWADPRRKKDTALLMAYNLLPEAIRRMANIKLDEQTKLDIATDFVVDENRGLFSTIMKFDKNKNDSIMGYLNSFISTPKGRFKLLDLRLVEFYEKDPRYNEIIQSITEETVAKKVAKKQVKDDTGKIDEKIDTKPTKVDVLKFEKVSKVINALTKLVSPYISKRFKAGERITFKDIFDSFTGKIGAKIFNVPSDKITDPKKNLTYAKKIINGIPESSEAGNIQNFYATGDEMRKLIRILPKENVSSETADINQLGENIDVSRDVLGKSLGLNNRMLNYFYNKTNKRSKGLSSQPYIWELKPEFISPTSETIEKAKRDIGITPRGELNIYNRDIGQLLKGIAKFQSQQTSISLAQRKLDDIKKKTPKEETKTINQQIADLTTVQSEVAFSKRVENILGDFNLLKKDKRGEYVHYYEIKAGPKDNRYVHANRYLEDIKELHEFFGPGFLNANELINGLRGIPKDIKEYIRAELKKFDFNEGTRGKFPKRDFNKYIKSKSNGKGPLTVEHIEKAGKKAIDEYNKQAEINFDHMWNKISEAVRKKPTLAVPILIFLSNAVNSKTHPHRAGAIFTHYDKTIKGKVYLEHALQNVNAMEFLMRKALDPKVNFKEELKSLKENYKLIGVSTKDNSKLDKGSYIDENGKVVSFKNGMGKGWDVYNDKWWQRYFNDIIGGLEGGINPNNFISVETGVTMAKEFNINSDGKPAITKINYSKNKTLNDAIVESRKIKESKGITVLDFDDTLATTKSLVKYTTPDGTTGTLNAEEYAKNYQDLLELGYKFDFSEFNKVVDAKLAPLFNKALKLQKKFGPENMFVLTARPAAAQKAIFDYLKANGLNIPLKNITGLGNSTAEAKALWMADKVGEGYNDFYFADDALQNVPAVKNMLDQFDVKSKVQQAKINFSKKLDTDFNQILQEVKGIDAGKRFSAVKAKKRGAKRGKWNIFIPPSADDFNGLLYYFLGKGKKGEQHMEFFKKALINPLNRAYRELNDARQTIANDYKTLKKEYSNVRKKLNKTTPDGDFTYSDAIRVYLWDKFNFEIPGLSKTDQKNLSDLVKNDPDLRDFAEALAIISKQKDGYIKPGEYWLTEDIRNDLDNATNKVGRKQFFQEFIDNSEIIFSKENLNKIEAIYGSNFREALEDHLYAIINGTNRTFGNNRIVNNFMNWINGSIGATMFFNARSAVLQTISTVNFINWSDNNVFKAAAAFANQKQFWKDFAMIFNSNFLKQRRTGLKTDINAAELAGYISKSKEPMKAAVNWLLNKGFLPTQIMDSFAIAAGGATLYRNRVKSYIKQGLSKTEAENKAFLDMQEIAEETQQSARPDKLSQQQRSVLGRLILAFQNVTMQYARLGKKATLDLVNGRGDAKTNISKIIYYLGVQNLIFYSLQTALFAMAFGDDDDENNEFFKKKKHRVINGSIDSILRGMGVTGAVISTLKNVALKFHEQEQKPKWKQDEYAELLEALQISPPIGIKARKLVNAKRTYKWDQDVMREMPLLDIDNPIWDAVGNVVEATTNVPLARLNNKVTNIREALNAEHKAWQRVSLSLGWSTWNLGIEGASEAKIEEAEKRIKERKKLEKEKKKKVTTTTGQKEKKVTEKNLTTIEKKKKKSKKTRKTIHYY